MKYLNYYSLKHNYRKYGKEKLFLDKNRYINYSDIKVFFICNEEILFKNNKIFFHFLNFSKLPNYFKKNANFIVAESQHPILAIKISKQLKNRDRLFDNTITRKVRDCINSLNKKESSIISAAFFLIKWQNANNYCGFCGGKTKTLDFGHVIICKNKVCKKRVFPRINPTIIVNVIHKNKILLARNKSWPNSLYSCIAGFCENNESIEDTVKREVFEEVGLMTKNISYKFSQFWPFPNNLMLGFFAYSDSNKLTVNKNELEDANWFSYKDLFSSSKKIILPHKRSIAFSLINLWSKSFKHNLS